MHFSWISKADVWSMISFYVYDENNEKIYGPWIIFACLISCASILFCLHHCLTAPTAQSVLHGCQPCNKFLSERHPCTPLTPLGYTRKPIASHLCPSLAHIPGIPRMNPAPSTCTGDTDIQQKGPRAAWGNPGHTREVDSSFTNKITKRISYTITSL